MPIIKIEKREPGYAMIDNRALNDPRLSLKARGLLVYLLSKPNDWKVRVTDIANNHTDGEHAVRAALKELIEIGYADVRKVRDVGGLILEWIYTVREEPLCGFPHVDNQQVDKPHVDKPHVENRDVNNTYLTKKEDTKKERTKKEVQRLREPQQLPPVSSDSGEALQVYAAITGMMAFAARSMDDDIRRIGALVRAHGVQGAIEYATPYYQAWTERTRQDGKKYSRLNTGWLDWAIAGEIPTEYKPQTENTTRITGGYRQ